MKAKMIKVSAAVTADVLFILQAVGTNLLATAMLDHLRLKHDYNFEMESDTNN